MLSYWLMVRGIFCRVKPQSLRFAFGFLSFKNISLGNPLNETTKQLPLKSFDWLWETKFCATALLQVWQYFLCFLVCLIPAFPLPTESQLSAVAATFSLPARTGLEQGFLNLGLLFGFILEAGVDQRSGQSLIQCIPGQISMLNQKDNYKEGIFYGYAV